MNLAVFTRNRLKQLRLSPRNRARASNMAEFYIAEHQTPSNRRHTHDQLERVLQLPPGELSKLADAERREHLAKRLDQQLLYRRPETTVLQAESGENDM